MALNKKQMMYGVVLVTAAGGFIWDRMSGGGGPAPAQGAAATAAPSASDQPAQTTAKDGGAESQASNDSKIRPSPTTGPVAIGLRLSAVAGALCLNPANADSAFSVPPGWVKLKPVTEATPQTPQPAAPDRAELDRGAADAFRQKHHLDAVMMGKRATAMVDGHGVRIGQTLDKFELLSVTKTTATFGLRDARAELRLPAKTTSDGQVIEDARTGTDDAIQK
jgi:hypothetical protein